ncbi:NAD-dependent epimerase/dehydratase family protein [Solidesulfovibrio sp. C21]|uniref:NAD-dependent epimerase/dehydratase family protein n=1 Tax=Solidesulfovibrio sp. C21 TaxID=3398613 RepID=UPI0039FC0ECA
MSMSKYQTMLVTGGAGFVGSNLAVSFKRRYPELTVIVLDNLKRRGSEFNVPRLAAEGIRFVHGDIRNPEDMEFTDKIDILLECSAEPSVLAGFGGSPKYLINTNLTGTINCLEVARRNAADVVFLSTSRVYPYDPINAIPVREEESRFVWDCADGPRGWSSAGLDIDFDLNGPKSMYGATKLCSEFVLREYEAMYGVRAVINRCGVIAGPWQFGKVDQGVFSLWVQAHHFKRSLSYIGFGGLGKQVRDLLHVDDLFDLLDIQLGDLEKAKGKVYNVGGGTFSSLSLLETTRLCEEMTGNAIAIRKDPVNRPADLAIYIGDNRRVTADFGWQPKRDAATILRDLLAWVREQEASLKTLAGL